MPPINTEKDFIPINCDHDCYCDDFEFSNNFQIQSKVTKVYFITTGTAEIMLDRQGQAPTSYYIQLLQNPIDF